MSLFCVLATEKDSRFWVALYTQPSVVFPRVMKTLRSVVVIFMLLATSLRLHCQTVSNTLFDSSQVQADISKAHTNLTGAITENKQTTNISPVSAPETHTEQKTHPTAADFSPEDLQRMKAMGVSPEDLVLATNDNIQQAETPQTIVWLDSFMGMTNAMLPVELIAVKKGSLRFRFASQEYNFSGNFTVMLTTPRKHKNPKFGFGSPDKASLVILENVGDSLPSIPLPDATIWEKSTGFIDVEALGKEWIRSGSYTIQN